MQVTTEDTRLLVVSGTGRNVGKTELVCRIIARFAGSSEITGLKVSTIFPDEELYHGDHSTTGRGHTLFKETRYDTKKDTSRMLRAGATEVYYLQGESSSLVDDYQTLREQVGRQTPIVCESNSLALLVRPGLHIGVAGVDSEVKPRARPLLEVVDIIIRSDGRSGFPGIERIELNRNYEWQLHHE